MSTCAADRQPPPEATKGIRTGGGHQGAIHLPDAEVFAPSGALVQPLCEAEGLCIDLQMGSHVGAVSIEAIAGGNVALEDTIAAAQEVPALLSDTPCFKHGAAVQCTS
jgi:hypothetical protein